MIKKIGGKIYNTETGIKLTCENTEETIGSIHYYYHYDLYQKRKRFGEPYEFFKYIFKSRQGTSGVERMNDYVNEDIEPVSKTDAINWLERTGKVNAVEFYR